MNMKGSCVMKLRHEWKHEISYSEAYALKTRLSLVMETDENSINGKYLVRSLYFDNLNDKVLREKLDGVSRREKFRLRYYNNNTDFIVLEKKSKLNGLCSKEKVQLNIEEVKAVLNSDFTALENIDKPLVQELLLKMKTSGLRPKTIVDYDREAFVFGPGNVRVTIDSNIRTGMMSTDFLNPNAITIPAGDAPIVLEVKWDEFLPAFVRDLVQMKQCRTSAFSKYASCRIYG